MNAHFFCVVRMANDSVLCTGTKSQGIRIVERSISDFESDGPAPARRTRKTQEELMYEQLFGTGGSRPKGKGKATEDSSNYRQPSVEEE